MINRRGHLGILAALFVLMWGCDSSPSTSSAFNEGSSSDEVTSMMGGEGEGPPATQGQSPTRESGDGTSATAGRLGMSVDTGPSQAPSGGSDAMTVGSVAGQDSDSADFTDGGSDATGEAVASDCMCSGRQVCVEGICEEPEVCMAHMDCLDDRICFEGACIDGCAEDADCARALVCDTESRRCIEKNPCTVERHCFENRICGGGICSDRCISDESCAGAQICNRATGSCEAPLNCSIDDDCLGIERCIGGSCSMGCGMDADCPGAQRCEGGTCTEPDDCARDLDCSGQRICDGGNCRAPCNEADEGAACPGDLECDRITGRCLEASSCESDAGCFADNRCEDGACVARCSEQNTCPGALRCNLEAGECEEASPCFNEAGCLTGRVCREGACIDSCATTGCEQPFDCDQNTGLCVEPDGPCRSDDECLDDRYCLAGVCADPCRDNGDCAGIAPGFPQNLQCVDQKCAETDRCSFAPMTSCLGDRVCIVDLNQCADSCAAGGCSGTLQCSNEGFCVENPTGECAGDRDCLGSRVCHPEAGVCVDRCTGSTCPIGQECTPGGYCDERESCAIDGECLAERQCLHAQCRTVQCQGHSDCPGGESCVNWACIPDANIPCECGGDRWSCDEGQCLTAGPCQNDGMCGGNHCRSNGLCGECPSGVCPGATACVDGRCMEPDSCATFGVANNSNCVGDRFCEPELMLCRPNPACLDDLMDPHSTSDTALVIGAQRYTGLFACEGEDDWYELTTENTLVIRALFSDGRVPLDLELYFGTASPILVDRSDGGPRESTVVGIEPGDYLLRVSRPPAGPNEYSLDVRTHIPCPLDASERPWRNESSTLARPVSFGTVNGLLCANDNDWFVFSGAESALVSGNVELRDEDGRPLGTDDEGLPVVDAGMPFQVVTDTPGIAYSFDLESNRRPQDSCDAASEGQTAAELANLVGQTTPLDFIGALDNFVSADCLNEGALEAVHPFALTETSDVTVDFSSDSDGFLMLGARAIFGADCAGVPIGCVTGQDALRARSLPPGNYYLVAEGPVDASFQINASGPFDCGRATPLVLDASGNDSSGARTVETSVSLEDDSLAVTDCFDGADGAIGAQALMLAEDSDVNVRALFYDEPTDGDDEETRVGFQGSLALTNECLSPGERTFCAELGQGPEITERNLPAGIWYVMARSPGAAVAELVIEVTPSTVQDNIGDDCSGSALALSANSSIGISIDPATSLTDAVDSSACGNDYNGLDLVLPFTVSSPLSLSARVMGEVASASVRLQLSNVAGGQCSPHLIGPENTSPTCGMTVNGQLDTELAPGTYAIVIENLAGLNNSFVLMVETSE